MKAIGDCQEAVHARGCQRVTTVIKIETRKDKPMQGMHERVQSVHELIKEE
ncbi:hypothetical protein DFJ73DRAFT_339246 [Zopfochytrium polystomum]|nr:hypothetical protein DFJ73DRAFT_339246 [Zopfochytrium polystomum]